MRNWDKEYILEDLLKENIISLDRGRVISSVDLAKYPGVFPVYSSSSQKNGLFGCYDRYDFDEELITWSVDGGGYFFYRPKHKFSVTNVSGVLKINKPELFDYKFLYYNLAFQHASQYYDYSDKAHPSVIKKQYLIPKIDLDEQQKIASILSKLDEAITQTEQLIGKYKKIKEGLMHDLLTRGIDEQGNIRSEETHKFKDSPLGRIPEEWEVKKLIDLCIKIVDCPHSTPNYLEEGVLVARTQNIKQGRYLIETSSYVCESEYLNRVSRLIPEYGDIIFTREAPIGEAFAIPKEMKICLGQRVMLFRVNSNLINSEFLVELIYSEWIKRIFDSINGGSTVSHLNVEDVKKLFFLKPPLNEQKQIMKILDKTKVSINSHIKIKEKLQLQKSGLMNDLLTGKVRVQI